MDSALESLNEALQNAQFLFESNKQSLYSERCLAMVYQGLAEYHKALAAQSPTSERKKHILDAAAWYDKSLGIWSRWRGHNLAVPFSTNREKEVLRAKAALHLPTLAKL
jgi:hypothetical protein